MNLTLDIRDINGTEIVEGSRVCAYVQDYAVISRDDSDVIPIIELDTSRPKPIRDVPLFTGFVTFNHEQLAFEIIIENMMVEWETVPSRIRMGGGHYVYEVMP